MGGKYSRTKGHSFERHCAVDLKPIFPGAKRHLESQWQEAQGFDLDDTGDFIIQCKSMAKVPNIPKVFKEIKVNLDGRIPMVVFSVTNRGEFACVKWDDMRLLMNRWENSKDKPTPPTTM